MEEKGQLQLSKGSSRQKIKDQRQVCDALAGHRTTGTFQHRRIYS